MDTPRLIFVIFSYLVGSIPFGLLLARAKGVDVRKKGSGNIGATNVARCVGKAYGVATLVLDFSKGFFPILIYFSVWGRHTGDPLAGLVGLSSVLGHCFSIFLLGKGGKGVATAAGVVLALSPTAFLGTVAVFIIAAKLSGFVSVGSLLGSFSAPIWFHMLSRDPFLEPFLWLMVLVVWVRHWSNIKRLLSGKEIKV